MDILNFLEGKVPADVLDKARTYMDENDGKLPPFMREHVDNILDKLPFGLGDKIEDMFGIEDPDDVPAETDPA